MPAIVHGEPDPGPLVLEVADQRLGQRQRADRITYPPYDRLPLRVATFSDFFKACVNGVHLS